jgi:hypothetical protein
LSASDEDLRDSFGTLAEIGIAPRSADEGGAEHGEDARMHVVHAKARVEMNDTADGGLLAPMLSPCRSLILRIKQDIAEENETNLGVQITTQSGEPLSPGIAGVAVDLLFWSDLADVFVVPGAQFTLRYPNRVFGHGQVLDVLPS